MPYGHQRVNRTYVWIDSKVTLSWLVSNKPLQVYVRNRVDEIRFCYLMQNLFM